MLLPFHRLTLLVHVSQKVFANNALFSKIMPHTYPSTYLEMEELQLKLLEKQLTTKFFILGRKGHFFQKMTAPSKKSYSPKYVYWYQCFNVWKMVGAKKFGTRPAQSFRHSIDSHKNVCAAHTCYMMCIIPQMKSC